MFCISCKKEIPQQASYCPFCGKEQPKHLNHFPSTGEECFIICRQEEAKFSIFSHDNIYFAAVQKTASEDKLIAKSNSVRAGIADYFEPSETNPRHQKALNDLIHKLLNSGWEPTNQEPTKWYAKTFYKKNT